MSFRNRAHAGREIAVHLAHHRGTDAVVVALPRGGVPVALEVARALALPLDILVVRKHGSCARTPRRRSARAHACAGE